LVCVELLKDATDFGRYELRNLTHQLVELVHIEALVTVGIERCNHAPRLIAPDV